MRGSIKQRVGRGGKVSYQVLVEYPPDPATGQRVQRSETYPTEKLAQARLAEWLVELHKGAAVDPARMTVDEFLDHWLATHAKATVRPTTYRLYVTRLRHLRPLIGRRPLGRLTRAHVQAALATLAATLAPGTIRGIHTTLSQALRHAVAWGDLAANPASLVRPGRVPRQELTVWDAAQLRRFLAVAGDDPLWGPLWLLAVATGMRRGELLGLTWRDVDLDRGRLHVARTLVDITDGQPVFHPPKTEAGRRVIPIDPRCVAALRAHRAAQQAQRARLRDAWRDHDLVLSVAHGGPIRANSVTRRFARFTRDANLPPIRFHDLRHSHATLLLRDGVPVKIVSERLGHESITVTLDTYATVLPDMQQMAVNAVRASLFGPFVNKSVNTSVRTPVVRRMRPLKRRTKAKNDPLTSASRER